MHAPWRQTRASVIDRFVQACTADPRIEAAFVAGSTVRGEDDAHSDLDLYVVVDDADHERAIAARDRLVERLGRPLFTESFGDPGLVFVILAEGTDVELHVVRRSDLGSVPAGPHRVLLDRHEVLRDVTFSFETATHAEQLEELRAILAWFWHDMSHFAAAIHRNELWWAAGQLEQLRRYCVRLVRVERRALPNPDEPFWKFDREIEPAALEPLRSTFAQVDPRELVEAATTLLAFFRSRAPAVADGMGLAYPSELDRLVGARLEGLA